VRIQAVDSGDQRRCSGCGEWKPRTATYFVLSKSCVGGLTGTCRACRIAYRKVWSAANREKRLPKRRASYAKAAKIVETKAAKRRWAKDPAHQRAILLVSGMRDRSRLNGVPFDKAHFTTKVVAEWLRSQPCCECCGTPFRLQPDGTGMKCDASPSVDKIHPQAGYVQGNVALLCWRCNNLKRDASSAELQTIVDWMRSKGA
jgi:hypothetical protein